jgi:hypothetical protein
MVLFNNDEPFSSIGTLPNGGALLLFLVNSAVRSVLRSWSDQLVGMVRDLEHNVHWYGRVGISNNKIEPASSTAYVNSAKRCDGYNIWAGARGTGL